MRRFVCVRKLMVINGHIFDRLLQLHANYVIIFKFSMPGAVISKNKSSVEIRVVQTGKLSSSCFEKQCGF